MGNVGSYLRNMLKEAGFSGNVVDTEGDETTTTETMLNEAFGLKMLYETIGEVIPTVYTPALGAGTLVGFGALSAAYSIEYDDPSIVNGMKRDLELMGYYASDIKDAFDQFLEDLKNNTRDSVENSTINDDGSSIAVPFSNDMVNKAKTLANWMYIGGLDWNYHGEPITISRESVEDLSFTISAIYQTAGLISSYIPVENSLPIMFDNTQFNRIKNANYISLFYMQNNITGKWYPFIIATKVPISRWEYSFTQTSPNPVAYRGCALRLYDANNNIIEGMIDSGTTPRTYYYGYYGNTTGSYIDTYEDNTMTVNNFTHSKSSGSLYAGYDWDFDTAPGGQEGSIGNSEAGLIDSNYTIECIALNNNCLPVYKIKKSKKLESVIGGADTYTNVRVGNTDITEKDDPTVTGDVIVTRDGLRNMLTYPDPVDVLPTMGSGIVDTTSGDPITTTPISFPDLVDDIGDVADFNFPNIHMPIPSLPVTGAGGSSSLFTLYEMSLSDLTDLANYLWDATVWQEIQKFFRDPLECLISLIAYNANIQGGTRTLIKIGKSTTSTVYGNKLDSIFQDYDMGSVRIKEFFNNFLDYSPYTKISLYLPYIGIVNLNAEDVMNATISVKYRFELITGCCLATVRVSRGVLNCEMYQFSGIAGMQLPLTGANYSGIYKGIAGAVTSIAAGVATYASGGAAAPALATATGGAVGSLANSKMHYQRTGSMNGNAGMLGNVTPYIIIERPITDIPNNFSRLMGTVSNQYSIIGNLSGFNIFDNFDVSTVDCTDDEKAEITSLLSAGIFI